jgi:hypothetical protein
MEARDAKAIIQAVSRVETHRSLRPEIYDFVYAITGPSDTTIRGRLVDSQGSVLTIGELTAEGTHNREIEWDSIEHIGITTDAGESY